MLTINQTTRDLIFRAGIAFFVVGGLLVLWSLPRFDNMPNYLRIAVAIPVMTSYVMLRIDQYRNWESVKGAERGYAIGALLAPPMLLLGSLLWFLVAPTVRG
ncbi:hypothetical protein B5P43_25825 [Bacillus sp. SRB_336]|nr:hypothetical protein B5P43_25825 [Bacillus sp. SRB_336]